MTRGWSGARGVAIIVVVGGLTAPIVREGQQGQRALKGSRLISKSEPEFGLMLHGMNRLGQINCAIDDFEAEMQKSAKQAQLTPLKLPESIQSAPEGIHVTLWELAGHGDQLDTGSLAAGIEALIKVVFDTIATTWATFEGFTFPIPEAPGPLTIDTEPQPPAVDAVRLLKEITEQIEADRAAAEQTKEEIARINRPETGLGS